MFILTLPHGNADVERVFSVMADIKTKKRNRISPETLSALLRLKLDVFNTTDCCLSYKFDDRHIKKYKENLYTGIRRGTHEVETQDVSDSD